MKELLQFLLGIVLTIIGVIIFLQNVVVSSFTLFYRMGRVNVGGILIVLIVVAFIAFIVKPNIADRTFTDRIVHCVFRVPCDFTERIHALYVRSGAGTDPRHDRRWCRIHHQGLARCKQSRQAKQEK